MNFQQTGGSASFTVLPEGSLKFADAVSVINGARLDITLGERSVLNGAVFTDFQEGKGGSYISLGAGSIWQNAMHSNVTELTVSAGRCGYRSWKRQRPSSSGNSEPQGNGGGVLSSGRKGWKYPSEWRRRGRSLCLSRNQRCEPYGDEVSPSCF